MSTANSFFDYNLIDALVNTVENSNHVNFLANEPNPANVGASGTLIYNVRRPYLEITEQPAPKDLRFRYLCEIKDGRSAGSLLGVNSTSERKTYPTVRIVDYSGPVVIVVSCVTAEEPFKAHPHKLVGKEGCVDGICTVKIDAADKMTKTFSNLGILCVTKKEIRESLTVRERNNVDPFKQGFAHVSEATSINLNAVRLCFQAFLDGPDSLPKELRRLTPVVSDVIYDKKNVSDLVIIKLSHCSAPAINRQEMILLCEKVVKEDIQIHFYEEINNEVVWEGIGEFTPTQVHKQCGISFVTPKYTRIKQLDRSVNVFIQLRRPSDGAVSEPLPFKFTPENPDGKRIRWSVHSENSSLPTPQQRQLPAMSGSSSLPTPQQRQLPAMTMNQNWFRLLPPLFEPQVPNPFPAVFQNTTEPTNLFLVPESSPNELTFSLPEPPVSTDVQESPVSSSELFPPNAVAPDAEILDEMLQSQNMSQSNMSDSLTHLANSTFDRDFG